MRRRGLRILLALIVVAIGVRALLPVALERYVERVLDRTERYSGSVADVDVALLRGGYVIEGLRLDHSEKEELRPLLTVRSIDLTLRWRALLDGRLVGEILADGLRYNVVAAPPEADEALAQTGEDPSLGERISRLFPFSIDRLEIRDGELHYRDPHRSPPVDVALREGHLIAANWSNVRDSDEPLYGQARVRARAFRSALFVASLEADPLASPPDFRFEGYSEGIDLTEINEVLRAYANVDAESGQLSIYTEVATREGGFSGYVKPLIRDLDVLAEQDDEWSERLWEGAVGLLAEAFENQPQDRQAARIPIEGEWGDTSPDLLAALGSALHNAFIQALPARLEHPERLVSRVEDEE